MSVFSSNYLPLLFKSLFFSPTQHLSDSKVYVLVLQTTLKCRHFEKNPKKNSLRLFEDEMQ